MCVWNPGAVKSSLGNNVTWLAGVVKAVFRVFFRSPETAAVVAMKALTCDPAAHRTYVDAGETGAPKFKPGAESKPIPGASDAKVCASAWAAIEVVVSNALGGEALPAVQGDNR